MAFSQTAATSLTDVITQIMAYAVSNAGFANAGSVVLPTYNFSAAGGETMYRLSKGGLYWNFIVTTNANQQVIKNFITGFMSNQLLTIYPTSDTAPTQAQSRPPKDSVFSAWGFSGPYTALHMYTEGTCVHAVLEITAGIYNHISLGEITKLDTFTGGQYLHMGSYQRVQSRYNTTLQINEYFPEDAINPSNSPMWGGSPIDSGLAAAGTQSGPVNYIYHVLPNTSYGDQRDFAGFEAQQNNLRKASGVTCGFILDTLLRDSPNTATLRTIMFPEYIFILNYASQTYNMAGYVPGVKVVSMRGLEGKDLIYTDYQVFPLTQKNGSNVFASNSGNFGLAYRRIA